MIGTWRDAELLKQEAGIRRGGRPLENPVKHISLNWAPGETPHRAQMIAAVEAYLLHMGWQAHQAVLVAHTDKQHPHVHCMLNAVHPETGRKLDTRLERRRSQSWALAYEREQGRIHCPQRLLPLHERVPAPPRPAWMAMQKDERRHAKDEDRLRAIGRRRDLTEAAPAMAPDAWRLLKKQQRDVREAYFAEGKDAYRKLRATVLREVRDEYRSEWRAYYAARKNDVSSAALQEMRTRLIARQHKSLRERRDVAGAELRQTRRDDYLALLEWQRTEQADISARRTGYAGQGLNGRGAISGSRREINPAPVPTNMCGKFCLAAAKIGSEPNRPIASRRASRSSWTATGRWQKRPHWDGPPLSLGRRKGVARPSQNSSSCIQPVQKAMVSHANPSARALTVQSNDGHLGARQAARNRVVRRPTFARLSAEAASARGVALALLAGEYGQKLAAIQQQFRGAVLEAVITALMAEKNAAEGAVITKLAGEASTRRVVVGQDDNTGRRDARMLPVKTVRLAMTGFAP